MVVSVVHVVSVEEKPMDSGEMYAFRFGLWSQMKSSSSTTSRGYTNESFIHYCSMFSFDEIEFEWLVKLELNQIPSRQGVGEGQNCRSR